MWIHNLVYARYFFYSCLGETDCCHYQNAFDFKRSLDSFLQMNSDYGYVAPHIKMSEELSAAGMKVWLYTFAYRSNDSVHPAWMGRF